MLTVEANPEPKAIISAGLSGETHYGRIAVLVPLGHYRLRVLLPEGRWVAIYTFRHRGGEVRDYIGDGLSDAPVETLHPDYATELLGGSPEVAEAVDLLFAAYELMRP